VRGEEEREAGILLGKRDDIERMRADGLDTATIARYTGLSIERIEGLLTTPA
jgi:hypothetical protein